MLDSKNILVVEDDSNIRELISFNLKNEGHQVFEANDGEAGIDKARKKLPDLILLDLMLPGIQGLDVCRIIKSDQETKNTPIIMVTAMGQEEDIVKGLETGADDYITKPFSIKVLLARVKSVLRRSIEEKDIDSDKAILINGISIKPSKNPTGDPTVPPIAVDPSTVPPIGDTMGGPTAPPVTNTTGTGTDPILPPATNTAVNSNEIDDLNKKIEELEKQLKKEKAGYKRLKDEKEAAKELNEKMRKNKGEPDYSQIYMFYNRKKGEEDKGKLKMHVYNKDKKSNSFYESFNNVINNSIEDVDDQLLFMNNYLSGESNENSSIVPTIKYMKNDITSDNGTVKFDPYEISDNELKNIVKQ